MFWLASQSNHIVIVVFIFVHLKDHYCFKKNFLVVKQDQFIFVKVAMQIEFLESVHLFLLVLAGNHLVLSTVLLLF